MAEYIEREAAIEALQNHYEVRNAAQNGIMDECVMLMMRVPAADVAPVVKGEWEEYEIFTTKGNVDMLQSAFCPKCQKYHTTPYSYYLTKYNFCPNCGAKMEDTDNETDN